MPTIWNNSIKVFVSRSEVSAFNTRWPGSPLSDARQDRFEFSARGDLIDMDVPEHSDGPAAAAMADDCKAWLFDAEAAPWMRD